MTDLDPIKQAEAIQAQMIATHRTAQISSAVTAAVVGLGSFVFLPNEGFFGEFHFLIAVGMALVGYFVVVRIFRTRLEALGKAMEEKLGYKL